MTHSINCQCHCGETRFTISGKALLRAYCHCSICQKFNDAAFADITLFHVNDIVKPQDDQVSFSSHKFPPLLQRGNCKSCGKAAIEYLNVPAMPEVVIVPSGNIQDEAIIPDPSLHIFYNNRVTNVADQLPKHSGYFKSEIALGAKVVAALLARRKQA